MVIRVGHGRRTVLFDTAQYNKESVIVMVIVSGHDSRNNVYKWHGPLGEPQQLRDMDLIVNMDVVPMIPALICKSAHALLLVSQKTLRS